MVTVMVLAALSTLAMVPVYDFDLGLAGVFVLDDEELVCAFVVNANRVRPARRPRQVFANDFIFLLLIGDLDVQWRCDNRRLPARQALFLTIYKA